MLSCIVTFKLHALRVTGRAIVCHNPKQPNTTGLADMKVRQEQVKS